MHVSKPLFSGLLLVAVVVASNIDDVPHQCRDICAPVVSLASSCDDRSDRINEDNDDDDDDELSCICNGSDASTSIPMCDACITEYGNDGSDNGRTSFPYFPQFLVLIGNRRQRSCAILFLHYLLLYFDVYFDFDCDWRDYKCDHDHFGHFRYNKHI
jgi:hypothetical protein